MAPGPELVLVADGWVLTAVARRSWRESAGVLRAPTIPTLSSYQFPSASYLRLSSCVPLVIPTRDPQSLYLSAGKIGSTKWEQSGAGASDRPHLIQTSPLLLLLLPA